MKKSTQSILWLILFLVAAEVGLRRLPGGMDDENPSYQSSREYAFILGSSRVRRGISPTIIESNIKSVIPGSDPWSAVICKRGISNVGLYGQYMSTIRPWAISCDLPNAVILVEARGAAFNDNYVPFRDSHFLNSQEDSPQRPSRFDLEATAKRLMRTTHISGIRSRLETWWASRTAKKSRWEHQPKRFENYLQKFTWGRKDRGFNMGKKKETPTSLEKWREHYTGELLKDYSLGGLQTGYFRRLIRTIKDDGYEVGLFVMPLTEGHKTFYEDGDLEQFRKLVRAIAEEEGVPLLDLDERCAVPDSLFWDSHHLALKGAEFVTPVFARELVVPLLDRGRLGKSPDQSPR